MQAFAPKDQELKPTMPAIKLNKPSAEMLKNASLINLSALQGGTVPPPRKPSQEKEEEPVLPKEPERAQFTAINMP